MSSPSVSDIPNLKVADLKKELQSRGLNTGGLKAELVERLQEAINKESQTNKQPSTASSSNPTPSAAPAPASVSAPVSNSSSSSHASSSVPLVGLLDPSLEAKKRRAEKFGTELVISEEEKFRQRAARFGLEENKRKISQNNQEQKGINKKAKEESAKKELSPEEAERLAKRAAKFGLPNPTEEEAKKAARAAKFANN
jgi:SAP domain-containing ribonucleoprotein